MAERMAKVIRVLTVPPAMAAVLICALSFMRSDVFTRTDTVTALVCIVIIPLLAYPTACLLRGGRELGRRLAFIFSGAGYLCAWCCGMINNSSSIARLVFTTYLISVILLTVFNKVLHIRASGHACGTAGPLLMMCFIFGGCWVPVCLAVCAAAFWASLRIKRHTACEFILGALCFAAAGTVSALICIV